MTKEERLKLDGAVNPVLFYRADEPNGCYSNFDLHGFWLPHPYTAQRTWHKSGEHRYQAMKATNGVDYNYVVNASSPFQSKQRGRKVKLQDRWGNSQGDLCWFVMLEVLFAKAEQNGDVLAALLATGNRFIYEDSPIDDIWGWRYHASHTGKNLLGLGWMHVRETIRKDHT